MLKRYKFYTGLGEPGEDSRLNPRDVDLILPDDAFDDLYRTANEHIFRLMVHGARLATSLIEHVEIEKRDVPWSGENLEGFVGIPDATLRDIATEMDDTFDKAYWKRHSDGSRRNIRRVLDKSLQEGWTPYETARHLRKDSTNTFNQYAAQRIVRTESTGALNGGQWHARRQLHSDGIIQGEGWLSTLDADTRANHAAAHQNKVVRKDGRWVCVNSAGQIIGEGRLFKLGMHRPRYPGDQNLPAEERIHCRCATFPVIFEEDFDPPIETPDVGIIDVGGDPDILPVPKPKPKPKPKAKPKPKKKPAKVVEVPEGREEWQKAGTHVVDVNEKDLGDFEKFLEAKNQSKKASRWYDKYSGDKMVGWTRSWTVEVAEGGEVKALVPTFRAFEDIAHEGQNIMFGKKAFGERDDVLRALRSQVTDNVQQVGFMSDKKGNSPLLKTMGLNRGGIFTDYGNPHLAFDSFGNVSPTNRTSTNYLREFLETGNTPLMVKRRVLKDGYPSTFKAAEEAGDEITAERVRIVTERIEREDKRLEAKRQAFLKEFEQTQDDRQQLAKLNLERDQQFKLRKRELAHGRFGSEEWDNAQERIVAIEAAIGEIEAKTKAVSVADMRKSLLEKFEVDDDRKRTGVRLAIDEKNSSYSGKIDYKKQRDEAQEWYHKLTDKVHARNPARGNGDGYAEEVRVFSGRSFSSDHGIRPDYNAGPSMDGPIMVCNPERTTGVWIHETAHGMESLGEVHEMTKGFLTKRVAKSGKKYKKLKEELHGGYDDWEIGNDDDFLAMWGGDKHDAFYTGKYYTDNTEVLTMGLQRMWENPVMFAEEDPEFFKFCIGVLDGSLLR